MASPGIIGVTLVLYMAVMLWIGRIAHARISSVEDYVLAGRRLGLGLATPTLLATWFGAGTLLVATDQVRAEGMHAAALDPIGAGCCLLLAGWWLAKPLWSMGLLTLPDFYGRVYGPRADRLAAMLMIPGFYGWIAAQFVALAQVVELYLGLSPTVGLPLVAAVGLIYTLVGGMWAVTLTDAVQVALMVLGLFVIGAEVLLELGGGGFGDGVTRFFAEVPAAKLQVLPTGETAAAWMALFAAGALGNLPGQDLTQRIFAARSAEVARSACVIAGLLYLTIGMVPLFIGLAADVLLPGVEDQAILVVLAGHLLHPVLAVLWVVTVVSAVLSTIDSAILAPSTVLAHNLLARGHDDLRVHHGAVVFTTAASLAVAYVGESAWSLLETAYELGLVSLVVPLLGGLWWPGRSERTCLLTMVVGSLVWAAHVGLGEDLLFGSPVPRGLGAAGLASLVFVASGLWDGRRQSAALGTSMPSQ